MTRVEKPSMTSNTAPSSLPVLPEVKRKKISWKVSCAGLIFLLFVLVIGWAVWLISASGLITIPIVSVWAYKIPQPTHVVQAGVPLETLVIADFNAIITERLQAGNGELKDRAVSVILPESAITSSLQTILKSNNVNWLDTEKVQVAVNKNRGLEIFLPLANFSNSNAVIFSLTLVVENGRVVVSSVEAGVGSLKIPVRFSKIIFETLLNQGINSLNEQLLPYASVEEINYQDGQAVLSGVLTVEILPLK